MKASSVIPYTPEPLLQTLVTNPDHLFIFQTLATPTAVRKLKKHIETIEQIIQHRDKITTITAQGEL